MLILSSAPLPCHVEVILEGGLEEAALQGTAPSKEMFDGSFLKTFPLLTQDGVTLLLGAGKPEEFTSRRITRLAAKAFKAMKELGAKEFSVDFSRVVPHIQENALWLVTQGLTLGGYRFEGYASKEENEKDTEKETDTVHLMGFPLERQEEVKQYEAVLDGVMFARDLVNTPGNLLNPQKMWERIEKHSQEAGAEASVLPVEKLEEMGMGGLLTVGSSAAGGEHAPRMIVLRWNGAGKDAPLTVYVGKGVTLDTGGYCLKSAASQEGIKGDMAGAAAAAGAVCALARNKVPCNVAAVLPVCENRISPDSFVPGDVIKTYGGKTVEIKNTDAEGRLILADGVAYAVQDLKANRVLDLATLTGAVCAALGMDVAGALTSDQAFWKEFQEAAGFTGEEYWLLPSFPEYKEQIKSKLADLKNSGGGTAGTITAGLFVGAFAGETPWIHLDIAGSAWTDPARYEYQSDGATGAAVSTLYALGAGLAKSDS